MIYNSKNKFFLTGVHTKNNAPPPKRSQSRESLQQHRLRVFERELCPLESTKQRNGKARSNNVAEEFLPQIFTMMIEKMSMRSSSVLMLVLVAAFLSAFVAEASDVKLNREAKSDRGTLRSARNKPTTNKAKLESIVREQNLLPPLIQEEDLPMDNANEKWQSLNEGVEFIPADGVDPQVVRRFLEQGNYGEEEESSGMSGMEDIYDVEPFAYGVDEYDEYQQAWRLMGFIVDCNSRVDDDYYQNDGSGSGDQGTEDGCSRYVLWAAVSLKLYCRHGNKYCLQRLR